MSFLETRILGHLAAHGAAQAEELADALGADPTAVSGALFRLGLLGRTRRVRHRWHRVLRPR